MDYIRSVFDAKRIKLLISGAISLIIGLVIVVVAKKVSNSLEDQYLAERWSTEGDYSQATVFLSELADFSSNGVKELEYKIDDRLKQDSLSVQGEESRLWVYAYSAEGKVSVSSERNSVDVKAYGVGGDFFLFHPMKLVSGSYFPDDDVNKDLVVIDTDTAWKLFGSNDVVGQIVEIGGIRHIVTGVVKKEEGRLNDLAGNGEPVLFLSYDSLSKNGNITYINSFETLMPNPLTGYSVGVLNELVPAEESRFTVVENSGRFRWTKLVLNVKNFGTRGMNGKSIVFPYWENLARGYEDYLTPVAVIGCIVFLYPCGLLAYILLRMWKKRTIHRKDIKNFVEYQIERYREKRKKGTANEEKF